MNTHQIETMMNLSEFTDDELSELIAEIKAERQKRVVYDARKCSRNKQERKAK